jgi:ATP-dependent exoDNAse (exonuclease V) alpha subunit
MSTSKAKVAKATKYPLRHLSIRVPWHDSGWDGRICKNPAGNTACLVLKNIGQNRDDAREHAYRGKSLEVITEGDRPCCVSERGFFMSPFEFTRTRKHPYAETSLKTHGHFQDTTLRHPPFSADAIPFLWMRKERLEYYRDRYQLDIDVEREPELDFQTGWSQQRDNHAALLNCFFAHIQTKESLCFFYAKKTPLSEDSRRVIIGVGKIKDIAKENEEYRYKMSPIESPLRALLWERLVQHSIRPNDDGSFTDGFLMPYQRALAYSEEHNEFDPASIVAFAPDDRRDEFSYVTEHVTHDGAIGALLSCAAALRETAKHLKGPWDRYQKWIDNELGRLWKLRGPCPGLGAALTAFGIELGTFVAYELSKKVGENEDPWPLVDRMFRDPIAELSPDSAILIGKEHQQVWKVLRPERRSLLKLLSRFEITPEMASAVFVTEERKKAKIECTDEELLKNPYRLYEKTRTTATPISLKTIDRGLFPEPVVREKHPLPEPSRVDTGTDIRRIRAWTVFKLEDAALNGDTLLPRDEVITLIREFEHRPECPVTGDLMEVAEKSFAGEIELVTLAGGMPAFQLSRLAACSKLIRTEANRRIKGKLHIVTANWNDLLEKALGKVTKGDTREERARREKVAALKVLAENRFSILIGPAGTGKTTLLAVLCGQQDIANGGVLLLAPTGKARVRMQQAAKKRALKLEGATVASYLLESGRYDPGTMTYRIFGAGGAKGKIADTVIVDETSMMTEEMLAAVLEAVSGAKRIILVGDHRQLPPIGAGRPFADLVNHLEPPEVHKLFPKIGNCYAELTVNCRQKGEAGPDARLAAWFAGKDPGPGEEEIFRDLTTFGPKDRLQVHSWETAEECHDLLLKVLQTELKLSGPGDVLNFDKSLGGNEYNGKCYFNRTKPNEEETNAAESWQILSPVNPYPHGVAGLNRLIHQTFRAKPVEWARARYRKTPIPMGPELIVYGDKVINVRNQRRWWDIYPEENCAKYVANGEIGVAVGQFKGPKSNYKGLPWKLEVEFSSQPKFTYGYTKKDFGEEGDAPLELAYALTVHKAQGSEFGTVIFVLPNPCRLLSRELLYTALTRQQNRIVILFQGTPAELRNYTGSEHSVTARRLTNLFSPPAPVIVKERRYDDKHIHRTKRGELVLSKSEVIIANELHHHGIDYAYEKELRFGPDRLCKPDFTIEDPASGLTIFWEHCGLLDDEQYHQRWEKKKKWYISNKVTQYPDTAGSNGVLVVTSDNPADGFDTCRIGEIITDLFGQ